MTIVYTYGACPSGQQKLYRAAVVKYRDGEMVRAQNGSVLQGRADALNAARTIATALALDEPGTVMTAASYRQTRN